MRSHSFAVATNFLRLLVRVLYVRIRGSKTKSFRPPFPKGGRDSGQSPEPLSADSGTLLTKRSFEGLGELFSRRKVPLKLYAKEYLSSPNVPVTHLGTIIHIAKSITPFSCSLINALTQLRCRYQLFAVIGACSLCSHKGEQN